MNGNGAAPPDLKGSVKREDYNNPDQRVIWVFRSDYTPQTMPYDLPPDVLLRDEWLRASVRLESMWGSAVNIAITKVASLSWEVEGDIPRRATRAQELFENADVKGWVTFLSKLLRDFLTTNNGCFIEIARATRSPSSPIVGLHHLDSRRCRRTGDLQVPVIYTDLKGREHELGWHQVIDLVDMPSPEADKLGMGMCAAHRAWHRIVAKANMERYVWEKVSGGGATAIQIVAGMTPGLLESGITVAKNAEQQRGIVMYYGQTIIPLPTTEPVTLITIPLKDLPDGFDPQQERQEGSIDYANALGLDTQDLRPLTGQALGTGAQSSVLDDKAEGRGLAAFRKGLVHALNRLVLDDKTTFAFSERDLRDEKAKADVHNAQAAFVTTLSDKGVITTQQGLQVLVDSGSLPQEFLAADATSSVALDDEEKPVTQEQRDAVPQEEGGDEQEEAQKHASHNQKRHGWRYGGGGLSDERRNAMSDDERGEYDKRREARGGGGGNGKSRETINGSEFEIDEKGNLYRTDADGGRYNLAVGRQESESRLRVERQRGRIAQALSSPAPVMGGSDKQNQFASDIRKRAIRDIERSVGERISEGVKPHNLEKWTQRDFDALEESTRRIERLMAQGDYRFWIENNRRSGMDVLRSFKQVSAPRFSPDDALELLDDETVQERARKLAEEAGA